MYMTKQVGFKYADDVCMMACSEEDMNVIIDKVNECVMKVNAVQCDVHKW